MPAFPQIAFIGVTGVVVRFADHLDPSANRAAQAFASAMDAAGWQGVEEVTVTLASAALRIDPSSVSVDVITTRIDALLATQDWYAASDPSERKRWVIPASFEGADAPYLNEVADLVRMTPAQAVASITSQTVRVQALGFAPGQPYLGPLSAAWDIPRQETLNPQVPAGALVVAIRQVVLFTNAAPTGWRHIGRIGFKLFRPDATQAFALRPGDEVQFRPVSAAELLRFETESPDAGATCEIIT